MRCSAGAELGSIAGKWPNARGKNTLMPERRRPWLPLCCGRRKRRRIAPTLVSCPRIAKAVHVAL